MQRRARAAWIWWVIAIIAVVLFLFWIVGGWSTNEAGVGRSDNLSDAAPIAAQLRVADLA